MQQPSSYTIYQQGGREVRREPPPYPGYNRGFQQTAGHRQSYASSETGSTDMSLSSCENLSTSMRQDPQGEETRHPTLLSSPIDMAHPGTFTHNHLGYMSGSPTALEVKSANSSTFYVTGSVSNQSEDINLSSNYNTAPQMVYNNMTGVDMSELGGQQGTIMVPVAGNIAPINEQQLQQQQQQFVLQQQQQGYNSTSQYYRGSISGQNQNTQSQMYHVSHQQPQQHTQNTPGQQVPPPLLPQQHYSNLPQQHILNHADSVTSASPPQRPQPYNNSSSSTSTTPSPQNSGKQDPFSKWKHFYVNQKTQLQQYRFFQHEQQQLENHGNVINQGQSQNHEEHNHHYPQQYHHPHHQQYVNDVQHHPTAVSSCPNTTGISMNTKRPGSGTLGSGSMIAKLTQEFGGKSPQQQPRSKQQQNNQSSLPNMEAKMMPHGQERINDSVSNVRATNERIRSQTPDFLSERPSVSRQLPLRPSSANSKQKNSDRVPLSFLKLKAQKQLQAKQKSESSAASSDTVQDEANSSSSPKVDNNANTIPLLNTSVNMKSITTSSEHSKLLESIQSVSAVTASTVKSAVEQLEQSKPKLSLQSVNRITGKPRPRTASPQRSTPPVFLQMPPAYSGGDSESDHLSSPTRTSDGHIIKNELQRSYDMLDKIPSSVSSSNIQQTKGGFCTSLSPRPEFSRSQPDLSGLVAGLSIVDSSNSIQHYQGSPMTSQLKHEKQQWQGSSDSQDSNRSKINELDHAAIATRATQMVERLSEENRSLRQELEGYYSKVCRLQKFEAEIQKVTDAYEALVKHSTKRENLDKVMRMRLETETKKLRENNRDLKDQLEKALLKMDASGVYAMAGDAETKRELKEKDVLITKLLSQNCEQNKLRDKLEVEIASQKCRCEDNANHIEILEATLKTNQKDKLKMEDEIALYRRNEGKIEQLQNALAQLQSAAEKRENIEQKLRNKLEEEIRTLKTQKFGTKASDTDEGISSDYESPSRWQWMTRQMQEKEQEVLKLQAQVAHFEQKFIEEAAMRQFAVDAASMPKDAKIAALEQNSHETERLINEARSERLHHLEELYKSSKKSAEFEAKVKTLTAHLAEKEAMIQVLQKQTFSLSRTNSVTSLFGSPLHSPHQSTVSASLQGGPVDSAVGSTNKPPRMSILSRPSSGLDLPISPVLSRRELAKLAVHSKSNSDGAMLDLSGKDSSNLNVTTDSVASVTSSIPITTTSTSTPFSKSGTSTPNTSRSSKSSVTSNKSLRQLLVDQAKLFQSWQKEQPDDLTKECWQV